MNQIISYQTNMFDYSISVFMAEYGAEEQTRIGTLYENAEGYSAVNLRGERYRSSSKDDCVSFLYRSRHRHKNNQANPNQINLF